MTSMQASKKRRLPRVLSVLFGSSLVSIAMAMVSGPAKADWCRNDNEPSGCYRCYYTNTGIGYCYYSNGNVGTICCYADPTYDVGCFHIGGWCS